MRITYVISIFFIWLPLHGMKHSDSWLELSKLVDEHNDEQPCTIKELPPLTQNDLERYQANPITLDDIKKHHHECYNQLRQETNKLYNMLSEILQEYNLRSQQSQQQMLSAGSIATGTCIMARMLLQAPATRSPSLDLTPLLTKTATFATSMGLFMYGMHTFKGGIATLKQMFITAYEHKKAIPKLEATVDSLQKQLIELKEQQATDRENLIEKLNGLTDCIAFFSDQVQELSENNEQHKKMLSRALPAIANISEQVKEISKLEQELAHEKAQSESEKSIRSSLSSLFGRKKKSSDQHEQQTTEHTYLKPPRRRSFSHAPPPDLMPVPEDSPTRASHPNLPLASDTHNKYTDDDDNDSPLSAYRPTTRRRSGTLPHSFKVGT